MSLDYLPWQRPAAWGMNPCIGDERTRLTYDEFADWTAAVAEQFADYGVDRDSVVAIMLPNRVELLVAMVAAWRLGAAVTPINPVLTPAEAGFQLADASAALVVVSDDAAAWEEYRTIAVGDLRRTSRAQGLPKPVTTETDLALLIYTSGSTGKPKGVMLNHANIHAMATMMAEALALGADDHCLLVLPLFHANALCVSFLSMMVTGGQLSILARFQPTEFLEAIQRLRPTYFSAVPTIYTHLLELGEPTADTSSVRFAICGAAPAAPGLLADFEERYRIPVLEGYGLTECTCAATCNPVEGRHKPGTVGIALPGQRVAIMGPDGSLLPDGECGEVVLQGPNVMQGYLGQSEATVEAMGDGWLHTGDVGVLDGEGYLRLVDRIKDLIIRGGENLYPAEIESVLCGDRAVREAAVVGRPDPVYGEVPVAYVSLRPSRHTTADKLIARCARELTKVKVPVAITILDEVPKNSVGKIDKPLLRSYSQQRRVRQGV